MHFKGTIFSYIRCKKKIRQLRYINRFGVLLLVFVLALSGCASKKRKGGGERSKLGKFYHNTTSYYNGYFNADELVQNSYAVLRDAHKDNYTEILSVYDYESVSDAKIVSQDLDVAIEKVTRIVRIHDPSSWVDDCYVLMGEAQFLKQEYETAEETFAYFKEEFDPTNAFGRNYQNKKKSKKELQKERAKERKEEEKKREEEKKAQKEEREETRDLKVKEREQAKKDAEKERERLKKEREAAKKAREKSKKKGKKTRGKKVRPAKEDTSTATKAPTTTNTPTKKETPKKVEEKVEPAKKQEVEREEPSDDEEKKEEEKEKDKTAYSKGMIWYAKTLVKRDKYANASYMVKRLEEDGLLQKEELREVPIILADINIKEKNYSDAITYLDQAIELASKKALKARYAFIKGQLYQQIGDEGQASFAFDDASKWAKSFELEFMSELNYEKTQMMSGAKNATAVLTKLDKMIKEAKYVPYLDQLYYTKGDLQLEDGDFASALQSFSRSIANNTDNQSLKQETYYRLAYLFYDKEDYVNSKNYFDSTLTVIDKEDVRYREVEKYATSLDEIAKNIEIINYQDSLLSMASWSEEKIEEVAQKFVDESNAPAVTDNGSAAGNKRPPTLGGGGGFKSSSFFAYDPQAKQRGERDFKDKWGDIELTDNWRRVEKSDVYGSDVADSEEENTEGKDEDQLAKMVAKIKSEIPYSPSAKEAIDKKLEIAYFDLGIAYREKIQNYKRASEAHETLLDRFPDFEQKLNTYYFLYLAYLDLGNNTKAEYYKNKVLTEFPDTEFAKSISDPTYADSQLSEEDKLNQHYEKTYALFQDKKFNDVRVLVDQSKSIFGKSNTLNAKFSLLDAMALGSIEGEDKYIIALNDVITRYPNTPEQARADEILRFLRGDGAAFDGVNMEEVDDLFKYEETKLHYVAVVLYNVTSDKMVNAKVQVSNYNKQYHKTKKLQLGDSYINRENNDQVILIRRFKNKDKSMDYYNELLKDKEAFISSEIAAYSIYPITQGNYRKMIIEKGDKRYRAFFEKYYLEKE